jgi:hypothetical protein
MGHSRDEIDRKARETREQIDENLGGVEEHAESDAARYLTIAAVVVGAAAVATAAVLIYRRINRPARREQLRRMLVEALEDLPDMLRDLPDEVASKIRNPEVGAKVRGALENMIRRAHD